MGFQTGFVKGALAAGALAAALGAAKAQAPAVSDERMALAAEMVAIIGPAEIAATIEPFADAMWSQIEAQLPAGLDAALRAELRQAYMTGAAPVFEDFIATAFEAILPEYTPIMAEVLTADEMRAWLGFYETPVGAKLFDLQMDTAAPFAVALAGDPNAEAFAALTALNTVLRQRGFSEYPIAANLVAATPAPASAPSAAAIAARALVPAAAEFLADMAREAAMETVAAYWLAVDPTLPADAALREAMYGALETALVGYHAALVGPAVDATAAAIAAGLTAAELDEALAFYRTPEAITWIDRQQAIDAMIEDRLTAVMMPLAMVMYPRLAEVGDGLNAILARNGLPPLPM